MYTREKALRSITLFLDVTSKVLRSVINSSEHPKSKAQPLANARYLHCDIVSLP